MSFLWPDSLIAGLEISPTSAKFALLKRHRNGWEVLRLEEAKPQNRLPETALVACALPSRGVLVRLIDLPLKKKKDILAALPFQVEPLLPYPLEKAVVESCALRQTAEGSRLAIFAAKKELVEKHLAFIKSQDIECEHVTSAAYALARFTSLLSLPKEPLLILHLGAAEGIALLLEEGTLCAARAFELEPSEIQTSIAALISSCKKHTFETVLLLGSDAFSISEIEEMTSLKVVLPSPALGLSEESMKTFALPLGIALSLSDPNSPDFRRSSPFTPTRSLKRYKKPLIATYLIALCLFASLFTSSQNALQNREKALTESIGALLETLGEKPCVFQDTEELMLSLHEKKEAMEKEGITFPLLPQIPTVGDLLSFLHTHPLLADAVKIEEIHYTFVNRPDFKRKEERYRVKVEMSFTENQSGSAEAFKEAIETTPSLLIDPSLGIESTNARGKCRISFYLKDKTCYN